MLKSCQKLANGQTDIQPDEWVFVCSSVSEGGGNWDDTLKK